MKRFFQKMIISLILLLSYSSGFADDITYKNSRFGTTITFPVQLFDHRMDLPQNGDGIAFLSRDNEASLSVFGQNNALQLGVAEFAKSASQERGQEDKVTLVKSGDNWVVVSGYRGDKIFYERFELGSNNIIHGAILLYPAANREKYEAHLGNIMSSLAGPEN